MKDIIEWKSGSATIFDTQIKDRVLRVRTATPGKFVLLTSEGTAGTPVSAMNIKEEWLTREDVKTLMMMCARALRVEQ